MTRPTTFFTAWLCLVAAFVLTYCGHQIDPPDSMSRVKVTATTPANTACDGRHCVFGGLR